MPDFVTCAAQPFVAYKLELKWMYLVLYIYLKQNVAKNYLQVKTNIHYRYINIQAPCSETIQLVLVETVTIRHLLITLTESACVQMKCQAANKFKQAASKQAQKKGPKKCQSGILEEAIHQK